MTADGFTPPIAKSLKATIFTVIIGDVFAFQEASLKNLRHFVYDNAIGCQHKFILLHDIFI